MKSVESELASFIRQEAWVIDVYGLLRERPLSKRKAVYIYLFMHRAKYVRKQRTGTCTDGSG